jgi:hypothetical protein
MKESAAVLKVLETAITKAPAMITEDFETRICREAESLKGDAEQERKLAALFQKKEQLKREKEEEENSKLCWNAYTTQHSLNIA